MHYCFLSFGTWQNASFVRLREFGREFARRGHAVTYLVDDMPDNRQRDLALPPGSTIEWIPRGTRHEMPERRRVVKKLAADFVHVLNPNEKAFLALAGSRQKVVGDWDEWLPYKPFPILRRISYRFMDHWLRQKGRPLVVCSRYLQNEFKKRFNLDTAYIPYATYLEPKSDGESPFSERTIVYMGNIFPEYDHDLIIEAAAILKERGSVFPIELLGHGPDLELWRGRIRDRKLDHVSMPGFVTGDLLWRHLRHAHVLLFPIRPMLWNLCRCPSKTFAYMQAKRPIITNRVGEVAEALEDRAIYIEPTAVDFAEAMHAAMQPGFNAVDVDYGVEKHSWSRRADQLLELLEKVG